MDKVKQAETVESERMESVGVNAEEKERVMSDRLRHDSDSFDMNVPMMEDAMTGESATAMVCDAMKIFGAEPELGEIDQRVVWEEDHTMAAINQLMGVVAEDVAIEGTQMASERRSLMWGFVNVFDARVRYLERAIDDAIGDAKELDQANDGTEIATSALECAVAKAQSLHDRRDAFEKMRDEAGQHYYDHTGETWRPRSGSHVSKNGLTSSQIDSRAFVRAREKLQNEMHVPEGTLVAVIGAQEVDEEQARTVWSVLDQVKTKHDQMVVVHGGGKGVDRMAASWAESREIDQVVVRPDWTGEGRAAPFKRNDRMVQLGLRGVVKFGGTGGVVANMVDKSRQAGVAVMNVEM